MTDDAARNRTEEMVLLGQAGWSKKAIHLQVDRLCSSVAFHSHSSSQKLLPYLVEQALLGKVPHPNDIKANIGDKGKTMSESWARTTTGRLRENLEDYYDEEAKPDEIRLEVPKEQYFVLASRNTQWLKNTNDTPSASILEPLEKADVYARVTVSGRIDELNPDFSFWLVVLADVYYPQCKLSRVSPSWANEIRIGRLDWGKSDGIEFTILLVAADLEGDSAFQRYVMAGGDGFGSSLPPNVQILDSRRVIRRDNRPA